MAYDIFNKSISEMYSYFNFSKFLRTWSDYYCLDKVISLVAPFCCVGNMHMELELFFVRAL